MKGLRRTLPFYTALSTRISFLGPSARGAPGDPETTLTKFHPVCPGFLLPSGCQRISRLDNRSQGIIKGRASVSCCIPTLRPNVRVIAECGNWRKFMWKPLKEIAGLSQS
ncbi:hypothetical protein HAX54_033414 [Datura stramonium]|uniref:Uncharacterized protein n=1 Tax=Datura stramonium TaxID=4076 RepID=A0ABS8VF98_DATST|nr:hypothetical protein [Datura stramonium]